MKIRAQLALAVLASFLMVGLLSTFYFTEEAEAEMSNVDPYAPGGWCDVVSVSEDFVWNPRTCEVWVVRCPTDSNSCHMVAVEVRDE